ncbi:hypothetical protein ACFPRL_17225 [Pseudoclavibacter helvolus]
MKLVKDRLATSAGQVAIQSRSYPEVLLPSFFQLACCEGLGQHPHLEMRSIVGRGFRDPQPCQKTLGVDIARVA